MRAEYREARSYARVESTTVDLAASAKACGLRVVQIGPRFAVLRRGVNWLSWSERIETHIGYVNETLVVDIRSCCALPTQFEDWGRNERNVRGLFGEIEKQIGAVDYRVVPFCPKCGYLMLGLRGDICPECGIVLGNPRWARFFGKLRAAIALLVALTGAELLLVFVLQRVGALPGFLTMFSGSNGAIRLAIINAGSVLGVLTSASVYRAFRKRSE